MENGRKFIVLGVTGGIAAYKSAQLVSMLVKNGFAVQVIMTENACSFVGELTFRTLSQRPVVLDLWHCGSWQPEHVKLAEMADLFVVAPATANFVAKMANGIADDALSTFAATFECPALLAPAMNPAMAAKAAFLENVEKLRRRGVNFIGPEEGHVACGASGKGRMSEPEEIFQTIKKLIGDN